MNLRDLSYEAKRKSVIFLIFFAALSICMTVVIHGLLTMPALLEYVDDLSVDGSDVSVLANIPIAIINSGLFLVYALVDFLFGIILSVGASFIFVAFFKKNLPSDKDNFLFLLRAVIWVTTLIAVLICGAITSFRSFETVVMIFLPVPISVHLIMLLMLKSKYKKQNSEGVE